MMDFIDKLNKLDPMSRELEKEVVPKIQVLYKKKKTFLYKEKQFPNSVYLITKGCLRTFYYNNGKEKNTSFIFEDIFFGSASSVFLNTPAVDNAQFLENSTVEFVPHKDLIELYKKYPVMATYRRKITEEYCLFLEEKIRITENTASNRYKMILDKHPEILQRVSLRHIANFLGITQETLSRIRKDVIF